MTEMTTMEFAEYMRKHLEEAGEDQLREMVRFMAESLMSAEADGLCGASYGERSPERLNRRNGYRTRRWDTRAGTIQLAIPKLRQGSYFPDWLLEPRRRSERALINVVAECYVKGVSTRKVDAVVQQLGLEGISKSQVSELAKSLDEQVTAFRTRPLEAEAYPYVWLDALYVKSREDGRIANVAVIVATATNDQGHREVLGVDIVTAEDEASWSAFLRGLVARGLKGVRLVTSDAHEGLKTAVGKVLHGASWQRCRTHFMRNLLCRVPKSAQRLVATMVRGIFEQPDADQVWAMYAKVVERLEERFGDASKLLDRAGPDILAFTSFPFAHWRRIWSNNPLERLNKELRRRSDVVGIFPNRAAVIRLLGAVLAEQHDEWVVARRYLTIGSLDELVRKTPEPTLDDDTETPLAMTA
jgi:transposase-like protein